LDVFRSLSNNVPNGIIQADIQRCLSKRRVKNTIALRDCAAKFSGRFPHDLGKEEIGWMCRVILGFISDKACHCRVDRVYTSSCGDILAVEFIAQDTTGMSELTLIRPKFGFQG